MNREIILPSSVQTNSVGYDDGPSLDELVETLMSTPRRVTFNAEVIEWDEEIWTRLVLDAATRPRLGHLMDTAAMPVLVPDERTCVDYVVVAR